MPVMVRGSSVYTAAGVMLVMVILFLVAVAGTGSLEGVQEIIAKKNENKTEVDARILLDFKCASKGVECSSGRKYPNHVMRVNVEG